MAFTPVAQTTGSSASLASVTATIPATVAGNHLIAFFYRSGGLGTGALTSVTDSAGQTWLFATRGAVSGGAHTRVECWYMPSSASITSVTFNSATAQINSWNIAEWPGVEPLNPLDVASPDNSAAASSTSITTPAINTTVAGDLILAAIHHPQTTSTLATAGYTALTDADYSTSGSGRAAYQTGAAIGSYSASWTLGVAQSAGIISVAFKAAATGGGHTTVLGQATETGTAQPLGRVKSRTLGQAAEADTARPVTRVKTLTLGRAVETSIAFAPTSAAAERNATSAPAVTAGRTSSQAVTAGRTSTSTMTAGRTSAPTVSGG